MRFGRPYTVLASVLVAAAALFSLSNWNFNVSIERFMPVGPDGALTRAITRSSLARTMVLNIGGSTLEARTQAARDLASALRKNSEVERVSSGIDAELQKTFYRLYFPRRQYFISKHPEKEVPILLSDSGLQRRARALKQAFAQPTGLWARQVAQKDPLMLFLTHLDRLKHHAGRTLPTYRGQLLSRDKRFAVLLITTRHSAFSTSHQKPFFAALTRAWESVSRKYTEPLILEKSGIHHFSVRAEQEIRRDIQLLSTVSIAGMCALFMIVFASLRVLFFVALPILVGIVFGLAITLGVFGDIHGITLAFGTSLIGVCVDYSVHYFNHRAVQRSAETQIARNLRTPLWLGALTTVIGFAGIGFIDAPGVRQLSVFGAAGILAALLTTLYVVPEWNAPIVGPSPVQKWLIRRAHGLFSMLRSRGPSTALVIVLGIGFAVALGGLSRVRWDSSLRAIQPPNPELLAQDDRVRARSSVMDSSRMVITTSEDETHLLEQSNAVSEALALAKAADELEDYRGIDMWIWSVPLQTRNALAIAREPHLADRMAAIYHKAGFRVAMFNFPASIRPDSPPLTLTDLSGSPLAMVVAPHVLRPAQGLALAIFLKGVRNASALKHRLSSIPHTRYFDHASELRATYVKYRRQVLWVLFGGILLIFFILVARYRKVSTVAAAFFPAFLSAGAALGILAWCGIALTLMHVLAVVLIISMGGDYGIFLAETDTASPEPGMNFTSVLLAGISTLFTFGVLGFSSIPALRALGMTTAIGILGSMILAPAAFILARGLNASSEP
ncbi:MAG: MMPL family transporter [Myxococcales bacterium]|nr:MMPL family transporter [Myxococcales bacterium]MCB9708878.1 MMPL family transporter [Myxococcales bacterium]